MNKIEQLENRIEQLEKKLKAKENKTPNWKVLSRSTLTWNEGYLDANFEEKYSFPEGHEYARFDLQRIVEKAPKKAPKKLKYWSEVYSDLKETLGSRYGGTHWGELCYLVEEAISFYQHHIIGYILKEGKYIDLGGPREQRDRKEKGYRIYKDLKQKRNSEFFHQNGRHKGGPKWDKIEPVLRKELGLTEYESLRSIKDYIREQEK